MITDGLDRIGRRKADAVVDDLAGHGTLRSAVDDPLDLVDRAVELCRADIGGDAVVLTNILYQRAELTQRSRLAADRSLDAGGAVFDG